MRKRLPLLEDVQINEFASQAYRTIAEKVAGHLTKGKTVTQSKLELAIINSGYASIEDSDYGGVESELKKMGFEFE